MRKIIKNNPSTKLRMVSPSNHLGNFLVILLIFLMMGAWLFSGWPQIWQNPPIPPEIKEAYAAQFGRPVGTILAGSWTAVGAPTLHEATDEVTPNDDTDYANATVNTTAELKLGCVTDPELSSGHIVRWRFKPAGAGAPERIVVDLYRGTTLIRSSGNITGTRGVYNDASITLTAAQADSITDYCDLRLKIDTTNLGSGESMRVTWLGFEVPDALVITVGTTGTQVSTMNIPSTNNYLGGAFTFMRNTGSANVTQIIITETGTVNANLNLSNVKLFYETAATCTYNGTEPQFGTAQSFNVSEKATFSGTMPVSTSQVCLYVVLDIGSGASDGQTLEIEISNASAEVTVSAGKVIPATPIAVAGTTTLQIPVIPPATWKAAEDTIITGVNKAENIRLRIEVANKGSEAPDYNYLLEYASKGATCGDFIAVPVTVSTEHFEMRDSIYFTNGDPTSPQLTVPNSYVFIPGKMVEDPFNSSGNITLPFESYTEIEFVFQATLNATDGGSYCFRVTNAGTPLNEYQVYPELQVAP